MRDRRFRNLHHGSFRLGWRWAKLVLAAAFLTSLVAAQTPAVPVRADDLSDAVAQQAKLDKLIAAEKKQLASISAQQAALQTQITAAKKSLDDLSANVDIVQGQIVSLQILVDQVHLNYDSLARQEQQLQAQVDLLEQARQAKQAQLEERQQILANRLVAAYKTDQTPLLAQLLNSGSLTDALSDVSYFMDLGAQDVILADQIKKDRAELLKLQQQAEVARVNVGEVADQVAQQKAMLDKEMADLNDAKAQLVAVQNQLNAQIAAQQAANAKLAKNKAALAAAITANGIASDQLAAKIAKLAAEQGITGRIPSEYNGLLQWPMGGKISQEFGCTGWPSEPRVGNCAHFHQGIDIVAPCLTPVHAAGAGVVLFVGYNPADPPPRAWLVIIAHSSHLVTWYAHMTAKAPAGIYYGAQVAAGQVIGTENTTGHSTGCHLHWAVLVDGVFKNPRLFV
jgi:murein DD-endopeptidase MepM/ murein hydrolase activator NlpD